MGDQGTTGGAWGARDDASWWTGGAGEIQQQQQINEEIARSTAAPTHSQFTYKMTGGYVQNEESPQVQWWYTTNAVNNQQTSNSTPQGQSSPDTESNQNQQNGIQNIQSEQTQQTIQIQHQNLQQALQQQQNQLRSLEQQHSQQQTLQQMLQHHQQQQQEQQQQQQQQQQQALQQSIQQSLQVSQAQAQALVQAQVIVQQAVLQQQVAQTLQQQQIQAALQHSVNQGEFVQGVEQARQRMPRAKPHNKPRGRMTAYAFFVQTCREEHKKKHPEENVVFAAFSKKCAERWNTMSEKEKQRFHEMAEHDKRRYDLEMQTYVPPIDVKVGRGRKRHTVKDPNAPKRSLSAFFWFCNDERRKVKAENPELTMGDIAKELGRRWAAADGETKSKYEQLSDQDKQRYDREMTAYKKGPLAQQQQQQSVVHDFEADEDDYKCVIVQQ